MNSEESPCGENLEYSLAFLQLERSAAGRPEQQYGQTIIAAEEPNWNEVQTIASELLTNTKDLRIAIEMANAELAINGIQGFEAALQMICGYIENFWDDVHPQPHPDDHDDDPDPRANALMSLCSPESTLRLLRRFPIIDSQMMGRYTVTDLIKAGLGSEHAETKQPYSAEIQTAIEDCDLDQLLRDHAAAKSSLQITKKIAKRVHANLESFAATNLDPLDSVLANINRVYNAIFLRCGSRLGETDSQPNVFPGSGSELNPGFDANLAVEQVDLNDHQQEFELSMGSSAQWANYDEPEQHLQFDEQIQTRDDVVRVLDLIIEYYERHEPSNPIPLLLNRCKRLVNASFLDVIQDLIPDALEKAKNLGGKN